MCRNLKSSTDERLNTRTGNNFVMPRPRSVGDIGYQVHFTTFDMFQLQHTMMFLLVQVQHPLAMGTQYMVHCVINILDILLVKKALHRGSCGRLTRYLPPQSQLYGGIFILIRHLNLNRTHHYCIRKDGNMKLLGLYIYLSAACCNSKVLVCGLNCYIRRIYLFIYKSL